MGISTHTLRNGRKELLSDPPFTKEHIRREGGGRHAVLPKHPEWIRAVVQIIEPHTAGLPQNENVVWVPLSKNHDFATFGNGTVVPHGIYDVTRNVGYLTMGSSHDTSEFVCDNIERVWNRYLKKQYPDAHTIAILCDGEGSNSGFHKIVKQDLMDLANRLNMKLLVMHYPPYCSKFNPIEHRLSKVELSHQTCQLRKLIFIHY